MQHTSKELLDEFVEKGAALEHARWARWHKYFIEQTIPLGNSDAYYDFSLPLPKHERWLRQVAIDYKDLSEQEKESDRREVREYLPLLAALLDQVRKERDAEISAQIDAIKHPCLDDHDCPHDDCVSGIRFMDGVKYVRNLLTHSN